MADKKKQEQENEWISWSLIIFLFVIGLSPVALILLLVKLFGDDERKIKTATDGAKAAAQSATKGAKQAKSTVKRMMKSPAAKRSTAKWLRIGGLILAAAGLIACVEPIDMMIWLGKPESYYLEDLLAALMMTAGGGAMWISGYRMDRRLKRYAKYLAVMGDRDAISLEEMSRTLGYSRRQVEKDLQQMIDRGYFGGKAYLHAERGCLFRSGDADAAWEKQQEEMKKAETEATADGYKGMLLKIRQANDRIADPVLSEKIDRIEAVTAKIFDVVEANPKKKSKIDTFLNYYLPTTQKLLDSYAEFESAGVEGENLRQAKQRIEETMDKIIRGFEHQLDELYQGDAMDVDSDIRVMENMLRRDTATVEDDFGMRGMEF